MATKLKNALSAYGRERIEHEVAAASPHKLICMLYDGALTYITRAKFLMQQKQIAEKGLTISRAIAVIEQGLRPALDVKAGGELAENLDALYEYMMRRLLLANLNNDESMLDEVHRLLSQLKESWEAIGSTPKAVPLPEESAVAGAERKPLSYGRV